MGNKIAPRKNMKKSSIILLSIFSFIAFPNLTAAAGTTVDSVSYSCAKNEVLRVVYVNGADGKVMRGDIYNTINKLAPSKPL